MGMPTTLCSVFHLNSTLPKASGFPPHYIPINTGLTVILSTVFSHHTQWTSMVYYYSQIEWLDRVPNPWYFITAI